MPMTTNGSVELWWDAVGPGDDAVVLIPGRGDSSDVFPACFRDSLVAAGLRVVVFDARETGLSGSAQDSTLADMADDVLEVLDAAGVERAHVVALSMGGFLTVDLSEREADRIASITFLSAISPDPDAGFGPNFFSDVEWEPVAGLLSAMGDPTDDDRVWVEAEVTRAAERAPARPDAAERHMAAVFRSGFPTVEALHHITAPVLAIHGGRDQTLPLAHGQAFAREVRDARLVVLDTMGHLPTPAQWDVVSALVAAHVASATGTST